MASRSRESSGGTPAQHTTHTASCKPISRSYICVRMRVRACACSCSCPTAARPPRRPAVAAAAAAAWPPWQVPAQPPRAPPQAPATSRPAQAAAAGRERARGRAAGVVQRAGRPQRQCLQMLGLGCTAARLRCRWGQVPSGLGPLLGSVTAARTPACNGATCCILSNPKLQAVVTRS